MKNTIIFSLIGLFFLITIFLTNTEPVNAIFLNSSVAINGGVFLNSTNPLTNDTNTNITSHVFNASASDVTNLNVSLLYRWFNQSGIVAQSAPLFYPDSLVLYMPFDNDARDYALGNDGTVSGATLNKTDFKVGTGAYGFDGVNDYVNLGNMQPKTVSMWVKNKGRSAFDFYLGHTDFRFYADIVNGIIILDDGDLHTITSTIDIDSYVNQWIHLVAISDGASSAIYLNGQNATSTVNTLSTVISSSTNIGRWTGATHYANATIDDVAIWNRSLSATEIQQIYYAGIGKYGTELLSNFSKKNDNITVEVTPIDYLYWGSAVNSSVFKVGNIVPTVKTLISNVTLNEDFGTQQGGNLNNTFEDFDVNESVDNLYYSVLSENTSQVDCSIGYENTTGLGFEINTNNGSLKELIENSISSNTISVTNGYTGKGMYFAGTNNNVVIANKEYNYEDTTIEFWFYWQGTGTQWFSDYYQTQYTDYLSIYLLGNKLTINGEVGNVGQITISGTTTIQTEKWYFGTIVVNHTHASVYLNGILETTGLSNMSYKNVSVATSDMRIGSRSDQTGDYLGYIDDYKWYNRTKTPSEINQSYNANRVYFNSVNNQYGNFSYVIGASDGDSWGNTTGYLDVRGIFPITPTISNPSNLTYTKNNYMVINFTSTEATGDQITYYLENETETIYSGIRAGFNWTDLNNRNYQFRVKTGDVTGNSSYSDKYNFTIDTSNPIINLIEPINSFTDQDQIVIFSANITDLTNITACSLYIGNSLIQTNTSFDFINKRVSFLKTEISDGEYNWYITCKDQVNNTGTSITRYLKEDSGEDDVSQAQQSGDGGEEGITEIENITTKRIEVVMADKWLIDESEEFLIKFYNDNNSLYDTEIEFKYNENKLFYKSLKRSSLGIYLAEFYVKKDIKEGNENILIIGKSSPNQTKIIYFNIEKKIGFIDKISSFISDIIKPDITKETKKKTIIPSWFKYVLLSLLVTALITILLVSYFEYIRKKSGKKNP